MKMPKAWGFRRPSEQQKEENTIASQTAALIDFAREQGYSVPDDWVIEDEGFSLTSPIQPIESD
jgi:site-specific DNA recombinase